MADSVPVADSLAQAVPERHGDRMVPAHGDPDRGGRRRCGLPAGPGPGPGPCVPGWHPVTGPPGLRLVTARRLSHESGPAGPGTVTVTGNPQACPRT